MFDKELGRHMSNCCFIIITQIYSKMEHYYNFILFHTYMYILFLLKKLNNERNKIIAISLKKKTTIIYSF